MSYKFWVCRGVSESETFISKETDRLELRIFFFDGKRPGILTGNNTAANDGFFPSVNFTSSPSGFPKDPTLDENKFKKSNVPPMSGMNLN